MCPSVSVDEYVRVALIEVLSAAIPFSPSWSGVHVLTRLCVVLQIFQRLIYADKRDVQGDGPFPDGINVTIRRNYIYEDAYDKLSPENGTCVNQLMTRVGPLPLQLSRNQSHTTAM